jgi:drug/metabolite transporter (DMT)-like permease
MFARLRSASFLTTGSLLLAALCWGLVPVATRYLFADFTPRQLVVLRFFVAGLCFLPLLLPLRSYHWTPRQVWRAIFCGIVSVIGYHLTVAYGLSTTPAGIAGLLVATQPIWIILISALFLRERFGWTVIVGLVLSLAGIVLLLAQGTSGSGWHGATLTGTLLVLLAALMWSIYTVAVRPLSKELGARASTALTMVIGTVPLLALWDNGTFPLLSQLNVFAWFALALLIFGSTIIATILWNYGVAHTSSSQAGLFLYLLPLISVAGGAIFLRETISFITVLSGMLIIAGVAVAQTRRFALRQRVNSEPEIEQNK